MEKQGNPQLELFSETNESSQLGGRESNPFFRQIWIYEKTILIILVMLVVAIVAFSLGVEKGRAKQQDVVAAVPQAVAKKEAAVVKQAAPLIQQQGGFVIQVATFKDKDNALREADILKKNGFNPLFFTKGSYIVLCVGSFPDKETAQKLAAQLNKRYGNCQIIRRL